MKAQVLYKKNMNYLDSQRPGLKRNLEDAYNQARDYTLDFSEDEISVSHKETTCFIHSQYDCSYETVKMMERVDELTDVLIVFGFGLGYVANHLIEQKKTYRSLNRIIIVEPIPEVFDRSLSRFDLALLLSTYETVEFLIGNDQNKAVLEINQAVIKQTGKKIDVVYNVAYRSLFFDYYEFVMEWVVKLIQMWRSNLITTDFFKDMWLNNSLNNMMDASPPVSILKKYFDNKPVLIVSAGPSLNDMIDSIKQHSDKFYIAAVGSAIGILNKHEIVPDFYYAIDASPEQALIFDGVSQDPILVYADILLHDVVKKYKGPKLIMFINGYIMSLYIMKKLGHDIELTQGSCSVALYAMNSLSDMGFNTIYMIGQDLAYSDGKLYSSGAWKTGDLALDACDTGLITTNDKNGNPVHTDTGFWNMKFCIEDIVERKKQDDVRFYNLGRTGLSIKGAEEKTFSDLLSVAANSGVALAKSEVKKDILQLMKRWESSYDKDAILDEMKKIKADMDEVSLKTHEYLEILEGKNITEAKILKFMEEYSQFVDKKDVYKNIIERLLMPAFYSIDEIYKKDTVKKRQALKVAESQRLCQATSKIIGDLLATDMI